MSLPEKIHTEIKQKIGFEPTETIKSLDRIGLYIFAGHIGQKKVLLKIIKNSNQNIIKQAKNEFVASQLFDQHNEKCGDGQKISFSRDISSGQIGDFFWFTREYRPGESLSEFDKLVSLQKYDILHDKFAHQENIYVAQIVKNLQNIQLVNSLSSGNKEKPVLRYAKKISKLDLAGAEEYLGIRCDLNLKESDFSMYWRQESITASVGDLTPSNILVPPSGDIFFIDFEMFALENKTLDVAYLWLFLWRYPSWQDKLLSGLIKTESDKNDFCISVIRILTLLYNFPGHFLTRLDRSEAEVRQFNKKHIWAKYLQEACQSYDELIVVK